MPRHLLTTFLIFLACIAVSCKQNATPPKKKLPGRNEGFKIDDPTKRAYYEGSPEMRASLTKQIESLPGTPLKGQVVKMNRILSYGEPAAVVLEQSLRHSNAEVRAMSAYGLGLRRDPRALDQLATVVNDPDEAVRFEAATAMVRLGDRRGAPTLVRGLGSSDARVRTRSIGILKSVTGETFGYKADDEPTERAAAMARWQAWMNAPNARARASNP